jgi:hypothetical protein
MTSYTLPKPQMDGSWAIFRNVTFPPFKHPWNCPDTIESRCYKNQSFEQCLSNCKKHSGECGAGYYIAVPEGDSYCFDIRTSLFPQQNPSFHLRNKNEWESMRNLETRAFLNTQVWKYPPKLANAIHFEDFVSIINVEKNISLETIDSHTDAIKFIPGAETRIKILRRYEFSRDPIINYGEYLAFRVPHTTLILLKSSKNPQLLTWQPQLTPLLTAESDLYKLQPVDSKNKGKLTSYDDKFYIIHLNSYLGLNSSNQLQLYSESLSQLKKNKIPITFKFKPHINVYYCDKDLCKTIPLSETKTHHYDATYKGSNVYRTPLCFGICGQGKKLKSGIPPVVLYVGIGVIGAAIIIIIVSFIYRKRIF